MKSFDKYAHQKRYLKFRYASDEAYRSSRQRQMREYRAARYAGDVVFRHREGMEQQQRYAARAALLSMRYLFEGPPDRKCMAAGSRESWLLEFCREFLAANA